MMQQSLPGLPHQEIVEFEPVQISGDGNYKRGRPLNSFLIQYYKELHYSLNI